MPTHQSPEERLAEQKLYSNELDGIHKDIRILKEDFADIQADDKLDDLEEAIEQN